MTAAKRVSVDASGSDLPLVFVDLGRSVQVRLDLIAGWDGQVFPDKADTAGLAITFYENLKCIVVLTSGQKFPCYVLPATLQGRIETADLARRAAAHAEQEEG